MSKLEMFYFKFYFEQSDVLRMSTACLENCWILEKSKFLVMATREEREYEQFAEH